MLQALSTVSNDWVSMYGGTMKDYGLDSLGNAELAEAADFAGAGTRPMHRRRMSNWARSRFRPPLPLLGS